MQKKYIDKNVYDAAIERLHFIFEEFDNIFVSFSGGKDSGLLLNLTVDFRNRYYPNKKLGLYHQDFEAQYSATTEYVERTFARLENEVEPYWVCLPTATRTSVSNYEMYWYPWDDKQEGRWVRPMPKQPYVINLDNNTIYTYKYRMHQEDLAKQFGRFYRDVNGGGKTVCLLGLRADESLHRYSAIINKVYPYKNQSYISRMFKDIYTASPIYDWSVSDVWHANFLFGYDYNRLYDLLYMAGMSPGSMRVASPFGDQAAQSLNMYRVIDPEIWARLVCRVQGVNFGSMYSSGKTSDNKCFELPEGYTWKEYTMFLLKTLPKNIRNNYIRKFMTSIKFWHEVGGGLSDEVISELVGKGYNIRANGVSNYTVMKHKRIVFVGNIPDDTDDITSSKDIPSWKRMCMCILKNDHNCRRMGFGLTKLQRTRVDLLREKYRKVGEKDGV